MKLANFLCLILCTYFFAAHEGNCAIINLIQSSLQPLLETYLNATTKQATLLAQASFSLRFPEYAIYELEYRHLRDLAEKKLNQNPNLLIQRVPKPAVGL